MSHGLSDALEASIREYSKYLLELPKCKAADKLEVLQMEIQDTLSKHSRDVWKREQPVIQLLHYLCENHWKNATIDLGIDPHTMAPIVRMDSDDMMF